jgi:hypothetical protein
MWWCTSQSCSERGQIFDTCTQVQAGMRQRVDVDEELGRCRPSIAVQNTIRVPPADSAAMITALAGIGGCQAGTLTKCRRRCRLGTRVQSLAGFRCATSAPSSTLSRRISPCRAQTGAAVMVPAPHLPVR